MPKQSIAIVLDFDRVLFDADAYVAGLRDAVRAFNVDQPTWDTAYADRDEDGVFRVNRLVKNLAAATGQSESRIRQAIDQETAEAIWYLYADSRAFLDRFRDRASLYLLTFGCQEFQRQKIAAAGLGRYFDEVTIVEKPKAESGDLPVSPVQQAVFLNDNQREMLELARNYRWAAHFHVNRDGAKLPADFPFPSYADLATAGDAVEALIDRHSAATNPAG